MKNIAKKLTEIQKGSFFITGQRFFVTCTLVSIETWIFLFLMSGFFLFITVKKKNRLTLVYHKGKVTGLSNYVYKVSKKCKVGEILKSVFTDLLISINQSIPKVTLISFFPCFIKRNIPNFFPHNSNKLLA